MIAIAKGEKSTYGHKFDKQRNTGLNFYGINIEQREVFGFAIFLHSKMIQSFRLQIHFKLIRMVPHFKWKYEALEQEF